MTDDDWELDDGSDPEDWPIDDGSDGLVDDELLDMEGIDAASDPDGADGAEESASDDDGADAAQSDEDGDGRDVVDETVQTLADAFDAAAAAIAGTDQKRARIRMGGAIAVVLGVFAALGATAMLGWGWLSAILFAVGVAVGVTGPPVTILIMRDGLPLGGLIGTGLAIAAMIGFGKAALVRREDGQYEWTVLRGESGDYHATLTDGTTVPIDAERGELFAFGLGELAVVEARGRNVEEFRVIEPAGDSDAPVETRAGIGVRPPRHEDGGILVSLATIQRRVRGSASSTLVRRGRDKALDEQGGTGQLSQLWTMAFATILMIVGFAMTAGVLLV